MYLCIHCKKALNSRCDIIYRKLFTFTVLLFVREETTLVSYCILIPGSVRGAFKDHAQQTGSQQTNHSQQANIFPKIFVNHWGTPFKHDFNIIQKTARMEKKCMQNDNETEMEKTRKKKNANNL